MHSQRVDTLQEPQTIYLHPLETPTPETYESGLWPLGLWFNKRLVLAALLAATGAGCWRLLYRILATTGLLLGCSWDTGYDTGLLLRRVPAPATILGCCWARYRLRYWAAAGVGYRLRYWAATGVGYRHRLRYWAAAGLGCSWGRTPATILGCCWARYRLRYWAAAGVGYRLQYWAAAG
ncbi:hypothetical protein B0H16DRAFT_1460472 [Mycena metata]|uniref:Uncharacterized protein n=1 Tax=Mycena metata TaxID=1033252 RepID=A0AAD7N8D5_9AGAR|nr:hypothetical protein B0H16DRAFT_1460472 [Mycena metata]